MMVPERRDRHIQGDGAMSSKTEDAYTKLRSAITYGDLKPGEQLVAEKICRLLDVGRTPMREALRQLKMEGYVDIVPNKGAVVTSYSRDDVMAIYEVIAVLEAHAVALATRHVEAGVIRELNSLQREIRNLSAKREYRTWLERNDVFHSRLLDEARNVHLKKTVDGLRDKIYRYRYIAIKLPGHIEQCVQDHDRILKVVAARDVAKAAAAMKEHVLHSRDVLLDFLEVA
jgi:DNA-binding GntR family transcriptional regulator